MITSKLIGGLGNQMFQISAAYALSMDVNDDYGFDFNTCHTPAQGNTSNKYKDNIFLNLLIFTRNPSFLIRNYQKLKILTYMVTFKVKNIF
jgi:hypothetical protein